MDYQRKKQAISRGMEAFVTKMRCSQMGFRHRKMPPLALDETAIDKKGVLHNSH